MSPGAVDARDYDERDDPPIKQQDLVESTEEYDWAAVEKEMADRCSCGRYIPCCLTVSNEVLWRRHDRLIWRRARILTGWIRYRYGMIYRPEEIVGDVWTIFRRAIHLYDPKLGFEFSTYFFKARRREVEHFIRSDSMRASLRARTNQEVGCCSFNADTHERDYHLYRVPELDESWTEAIFELFDNDKDKLWKSLLEPLLPREKDVVSLYYKDSWTLEQISEKYGVTKERVRQIRNQAENRMRIKIEKLTNVAEVLGVWDASKVKDRRPRTHNLNPSKLHGRPQGWKRQGKSRKGSGSNVG